MGREQRARSDESTVALDYRARQGAERLELLTRVEAILDPPMLVLGLVFLGLVVVGLIDLLMTPAEQAAVGRADDIIYGIFVADFLVRLLITPDRLPWVRTNWALILSLVVPFLWPLRSLHALSAIGTLRAGQLVAGLNRGLRSLQEVFRGRSALYLSLLTLLVIVAGEGLTLVIERGAAGSGMTTFGDALWWSATLVTTVNSSLDPVTAWGRVVGWLMRVYAVGVFGSLTASIASYLVGQVASPAPAVRPTVAGSGPRRGATTPPATGEGT